MKPILIIIFVVVLASMAIAVQIEDVSYAMNINFSENKASLESAKIVQGNAARPNINEEYEFSLELVSFKNKKLHSSGFNLPDFAYDAEVEIKSGKIIISLPYYSEAKSAAVYQDNRKISELDLGNLASCDLDGFCSKIESKELCPEDCIVGEEEEARIQKLAEDGIAKEKRPLTTIIIVSLILGLIAILYMAVKKPRQKK